MLVAETQSITKMVFIQPFCLISIDQNQSSYFQTVTLFLNVLFAKFTEGIMSFLGINLFIIFDGLFIFLFH